MDIGKILREEIELAEDYPVGFDLREFSNFSSFAQRIRYCRQHLRAIGNGSSRIAFAVDNDKVLKIAKNQKGIAQNEVEAQGHKQDFEIVAKIFATDPNDLWIEMELAKKIKPKRFQMITGVDLMDMEAWILANHRRNFKAADEIQRKYSTEEGNEFWNDWRDFVESHGYETLLDYALISSFGEVLRDGKPAVVLLDYGVDEQVMNDFYTKKNRYWE